MPKRKPLAERFWSKVNKTETCWLWTAAVGSHGYGVIGELDKVLLAHRVAFEWVHGTIPHGAEVDHKCRVRTCVNPDHLQRVDRVRNGENASVSRRSTTGVRGVHFDQRRKCYTVHVMHLRKSHYGGGYATLADAEAAAIELRNRVMTNNLVDREAS